MDLVLGTPLRAISATFTLNLAVEKAVEVIPVAWYPRALHLADVIGLNGLSSFLSCFGLGLAFLAVACGIRLGSGVATVMTTRGRPFMGTVCVGVSVFAGCALAGALMGLFCVTLMTLGLGGLFISGFILSLSLLFTSERRTDSRRRTAPRILILLVMTFVTMHVTVYFGHSFDNLIVLTLIPAVVLMGYLADKVAFTKPTAYVIFTFILLVPLTGFLVGRGMGTCSLTYPRLDETATAVKSLVFVVQICSGLVGVAFGALTVPSWEEEAVRELPLWICGPAAVILCNLDTDSQNTVLHSLILEFLGAGGELGLISGLVGASGISLGLTMRAAQNDYSPVTVLLQGAVGGFVVKHFLPSFSILPLVVFPFGLWLLNSLPNPNEHRDLDRLDILQEAAVDSAVLGKVMMGATAVGVAGLLTAALGPAGCYGVLFGIFIASGEAIFVSQENR